MFFYLKNCPIFATGKQNKKCFSARKTPSMITQFFIFVLTVLAIVFGLVLSLIVELSTLVVRGLLAFNLFVIKFVKNMHKKLRINE